MGDLVAALRERMEQARCNLRQAREDGDAYGADIFAAELEDLERRATVHGIPLPAADDLDGSGAAAAECSETEGG